MPRLSLLAIGTLVVLLTGASPAPAVASIAHQAPGPDWEGSGLTGPVLRIFAPASGALLVRTATTLLRSDDGGTPPSWRSLPVPELTRDKRYQVVAVDPTNHDVLYTASTDGITRSVDGGQTWSVVLPTAEILIALAVSPANHSLVYVGLANTVDPGAFRFLRSRDAGASWEQLEHHQYSLCGWSVPILLPHSMDENRLFRTADCRSGANFYDHLRQSLDQGATWTSLFGVGRAGISTRDSSHPQYAYPTFLAGGQGAEPSRFYLATGRDSRVGYGTSVFRSDDDAQTWTEIFASRPNTEPDGAIVQVRGLTYDPARPDTIYLGRNVYAASTGARPAFVSAGVLMSADGGATWQTLGRQDLPEIHDLALGIDRQNLYVADDGDLRRLRVAAALED